jgi:site-specific DNA-methyltransferase (adenine-specific)
MGQVSFRMMFNFNKTIYTNKFIKQKPIMDLTSPLFSAFGSDCDDRNESEGGDMAKRTKTARPTAGSEMFASHADTQVVYCGDNLDKLRSMPTGMVDLIYIDPPFNSNRNYEVFWGETKEKRAFDDRHESTKAYIDFMRPRCIELRRVLKDTGSLYYHCDWHASHYVKVMLDQVFGEQGFQSEIIWNRTSSHGNVGKSFGNVTDSIFFYTKSCDYTWNQLYRPYSEKYIREKFANADPDGRHFTTSDMRNPAYRPNLVYDYKGYKPHPNGWAVTRDNMERLDTEGRLYFPPKKDGRIRLKRFLDESPGERLQNLWDDIPPLNSQAVERIGYPTQKPLPLLDRIIRSSSDPDDIVLDAFCGCGTALVAAQNLERRWIGIDISPTACRVMAKRLEDDCGLREKRDFTVRDMPHSEQFLRRIPHFEFENWAVVALGGIPNSAKVGDMGIDGRIYPVTATPERPKGTLGFMDHWYPIQVKQKDKAGRPDIDSFEAVMMREDRTKGFFVSFDYTADAETEIRAFFKRTGKAIVAFTVREIIDEEIAMRLI